MAWTKVLDAENRPQIGEKQLKNLGWGHGIVRNLHIRNNFLISLLAMDLGHTV